MITSVTNEKVKHVISLRDKKKTRDEEGLFVTEGIRIFWETPEQMTQEVYLTGAFLADREKHNDGSVLKKLEITGFEEVTEQVMKKMCGTVTPQGILSVIKKPVYSLNDLLAGGTPLLMVLEHLQDPGNLGTIMRSAEGAGVSGVIMSSDSADIFGPKAVRSTMGSVFRVPFIYTEDFEKTLKDLKGSGVELYGAAPGGSSIYTGEDYTGSCAFLIGNESAGLTDMAKHMSDRLIKIPMGGMLESLNAGVSASILLYEARRQRG